MKTMWIVLLAINCFACNHKANEKEVVQKTDLPGEQDKAEVDTTCYWHDLKSYTTPKGVRIDYQLVDNKYYFLKWEKDNWTAILPDTFFCDSNANLRPRFEDENSKYVLLRFGCGSPCWGGIALPLYEEGKPKTFMYHLGYDLDDDLIARVDYDEADQKAKIMVYNLRNHQTEKISIKEECRSAVPSYCVDSLSIKNRVLYFKWNPETYVDSKGGLEKRVKLKI